MNHIYKLKFSKRLGQMIAVSELAKGADRTSTGSQPGTERVSFVYKIFKLSAIAALSGLVSMPAAAWTKPKDFDVKGNGLNLVRLHVGGLGTIAGKGALYTPRIIENDALTSAIGQKETYSKDGPEKTYSRLILTPFMGSNAGSSTTYNDTVVENADIEEISGADNVGIGKVNRVHDQAVAIGFRTGAKESAVAIGVRSASDSRGVALGTRSRAKKNSVALGVRSSAEINGSSMGFSSYALYDSVAIGAITTNRIPYNGRNKSFDASTTSVRSTAIGYNTFTSDVDSTAVGSRVGADKYSVAVGNSVRAPGISAIAIGSGQSNGLDARYSRAFTAEEAKPMRDILENNLEFRADLKFSALRDYWLDAIKANDYQKQGWIRGFIGSREGNSDSWNNTPIASEAGGGGIGHKDGTNYKSNEDVTAYLTNADNARRYIFDDNGDRFYKYSERRTGRLAYDTPWVENKDSLKEGNPVDYYELYESGQIGDNLWEVQNTGPYYDPERTKEYRINLRAIENNKKVNGQSGINVIAHRFNADGSTKTGNTQALALGNASIAMGARSLAIEDGSIAIGALSRSTMKDSVALGPFSATDYTATETKGYFPNNNYPAAIADLRTKDTPAHVMKTRSGDIRVGVVSVGSKDLERRIINVDDGADDYDAVNVRQLRAVAALAGGAWQISANNKSAENGAADNTRSLVDPEKNIVNFKGENGITVAITKRADNSKGYDVTIRGSGTPTGGGGTATPQEHGSLRVTGDLNKGTPTFNTSQKNNEIKFFSGENNENNLTPRDTKNVGVILSNESGKAGVDIRLNKNLTGLTSIGVQRVTASEKVVVGNGPSIETGGINMNNTPINNLPNRTPLNNNDYGNVSGTTIPSGRAATEGAVKQVADALPWVIKGGDKFALNTNGTENNSESKVNELNGHNNIVNFVGEGGTTVKVKRKAGNDGYDVVINSTATAATTPQAHGRLTIQGDNGAKTLTNMSASNTLSFASGENNLSNLTSASDKNIGVWAQDGQVSVHLAKKLQKLSEINFNEGGTGPVLGVNGFNMHNKPIDHLADRRPFSNGTDYGKHANNQPDYTNRAATEGALKQVVDALPWTIKGNDAFALNSDGAENSTESKVNEPTATGTVNKIVNFVGEGGTTVKVKRRANSNEGYDVVINSTASVQQTHGSLTIRGDNGNKTLSNMSAGNTLSFASGEGNLSNLTASGDKNIGVWAQDGQVSVHLAKKLQKLSEIRFNEGNHNGPVLGVNGFDMNGKSISDLPNRKLQEHKANYGLNGNHNNAATEGAVRQVADALPWIIKGNGQNALQKDSDTPSTTVTKVNEFGSGKNTVDFVGVSGTTVKVQQTDSGYKVLIGAANTGGDTGTPATPTTVLSGNDTLLTATPSSNNIVTVTPVTANLKENGNRELVVDPETTGKTDGLVKASDLATQINNYSFNLKDQGTGTAEIKRRGNVTFKAGDNLASAVDQNGNVTYSLNQTVSGLTSLGVTDGPTLSNTGIDAGNKPITNVNSTLTETANKLLDIPTNGSKDNNAATVGDLKKLGWVISSAKTTGATEGATTTTGYNDIVQNTDEVQFVGTGSAKVSGNTTTDGKRVITVHVDPVTAGAATGKFALMDDNNSKLEQDLGNSIKVVGKDGVETHVNTTSNSFEIGLKPEISLGEKTVAGKDGTNGTLTVTGKDGNAIGLDGANGTVSVSNGQNGADGNGVTLNGKDGAVGINGKDAEANITVANGTSGLDPKENDKGDGNKTRITYNISVPTDPAQPNGAKKEVTEEVATLNDGLKFAGDNGTTSVKLNNILNVKGGETSTANLTTTADKNIGVVAGANGLEVRLAKNLSNLTGVAIKDGPSLTTGGIDAGNKPITNVTSGLTTFKPTDGEKNGLVNIPADDSKDKNVATVGDIRNLGWIVKADQTTGKTDNTAYNATVTNAQAVKFVGSGAAKVSGNTTTAGERVITVHVDPAQATGKFGLSNGTASVESDLGTPIAVVGKDGVSTTVNGTSFEIGLNPDIALGKKGTNGTLTVTGKDGNAIGLDGANGTVSVSNGKDGAAGNGVTLNGKDGSIGINGKDAEANITVDNGKGGLDPATNDKGNEKTRITYNISVPVDPKKPNGAKKEVTEEVATLNDGLKFKGDAGIEKGVKLNDVLNITGGEGETNNLTTTTDKNIGIVAKPDGLEVRLSKNLKGLDSVSLNPNSNNGTVSVNNNGFHITTPKDPKVPTGAMTTVSLVGGPNGGSLTGLENRTSLSPNYGTGDNAGRAATESAVNALAQALPWIIKGNDQNALVNKVNDPQNGKPSKNVSYVNKPGSPRNTINFVGPGVSVLETDTGYNVVISGAGGDGSGPAASTIITSGAPNLLTANTVGNTVTITPKTGTLEQKPDGSLRSENGTNRLATTDELANQLNNYSFNIKDAKGDTAAIKRNNNVTFTAGDNLTAHVDANNKTVSYSLNPDLTLGGKNGTNGTLTLTGKDGNVVGLDGANGTVSVSNGKNGADGNGVTLNGKDGAVGINGKDAEANITVANGTSGLDPKENDKGDGNKTRITYNISVPADPTQPNGAKKEVTEEVATLNDGLKFTGDSGNAKAVKLNNELAVKGGENTEANLTTLGDKNIGVVSGANGLEVRLAKNLSNLTGVAIKDGPSLTTGGIDAGNKPITNVTSGLTTFGPTDGEKNGLVNIPADGSKDKNVATVGDIRNLGWIVKADQTTGKTDNTAYNATVTNAQAVKFVGSGAAKVSGNTTTAGERVITVHVDPVSGGATGNFALADANNNQIERGLGDAIKIVGKDGVSTTANATSGSFEIGLDPEIALGKKGTDGTNGTLTVTGKDGNAIGLDGANGTVSVSNGKNGADGNGVTLNGKDGSIGINGKDAETTITVANGTSGLDPKGNDKGDGKTRITYEINVPKDPNNPAAGTDKVTEEVATLNDGLKFAGDNGTTSVKLNEILNVKGGETSTTNLTTTADKNIGVVAGKDGLEVRLAKNLSGLDSVTFGKNGNNGTVSLGKDGLSIVTPKDETGANTTTVSLVGGKDGGKLTGLEERTPADNVADYGKGTNAGRAATEGAVKSVADNVTNINNGLAGPVIYTDEKGGKVVKVGDKYYKESDIGTDGQPKAGAKAVEPKLSLVNANGTSTTTPVTLSNVGSGLPTDSNGTTVTADKLTPAQLANNGNNAVNVSDLAKTVTSVINSGFKVGADQGADVTHKLGKLVDIVGAKSEFTSGDVVASANNIVTRVMQNVSTGVTTVEVGLAKRVSGVNDLTVGSKDPNGANGTLTVTGKDGNAIGLDGANGTVSVSNGKNGADGNGVTLNGKDGSIGINGKDAETTITVANGTSGLDPKGNDKGDGKTRITYEINVPKDPNNPAAGTNKVTEEVATLNDGLKFSGDNGTTSVKLNEILNVKGGETSTANLTTTADKNIGVVAGKDGLEVRLAKNLNGLESITVGKDGKQAVLTSDKDGGKLTGLANRTTSTTRYGEGNNAGRAATEGAVKDVSDRVNNINTDVTNINNGLAGPVVYTDEKGGKVVKVGDKYYKEGDIGIDGQPKPGAKVVEPKLSLVNANGTSTTTPVTLSNVGSGLPTDSNGTTVTADKLTADQLTNSGNNAVNVSDLAKTVTSVIDSGFKVGADQGADVIHKLGKLVDIVGAKSEFTAGNTSAVANSILTNVKQGTDGRTTLEVGLAKKVSGLESIDFGKNSSNGTVSIGKDGLTIVTPKDATGANSTTVSLVGGKDGGSLTGLENRTPVTNNDYGQGPNAGRAATEGAVVNIYNEGSKYFKANSTEPAAQALGKDSISAGPSSIARANASIALGYNAQIGEGANSAVAIGEDSVASKVNSVSIGAGSSDNGDVHSYDLDESRYDDKAKTPREDYFGFNSLYVDETGKLTNQISPDLGGVGKNVHILSVGNKDKGLTRQIQNVAAGKVQTGSTDAVNGSQLHQTNKEVLKNRTAITNIANHFTQVTGRLDNEVRRLDKQMKAGIASAVATASLPQAYIPGKSFVAISGGTYKGTQAVAIGASRISDNGKMIIKVNGSYSSGDTTFGVGAGYHW